MEWLGLIARATGTFRLPYDARDDRTPQRARRFVSKEQRSPVRRFKRAGIGSGPSWSIDPEKFQTRSKIIERRFCKGVVSHSGRVPAIDGVNHFHTTQIHVCQGI